MNRRQIVLNALTTLLQVAGNAAVLFFLYRFLIRTIGVERLGIWSLVLATTSVVWLAHQGFSTSIVKFTAKYAAHGNTHDVSALLQTTIMSAGIFLGGVSVLLYPLARWTLRLVLPPANLADAYVILPFALASLWLSILTTIFQAGLAGHELITHSNYVELGASWSYFLLALWLVPHRGLWGLAVAQLAQSCGAWLVTWLLLRRRVSGLPLVPLRWSRALFHEMAGYGLHFQLITASQAVREPVTKALLARFGGLAFTGYYDLASRWVVTFRELLVQANQVLVPTISHLQEREPESIPRVYRESYGVIFFLSLPVFASLAVLSPLVSRVWIGHYEPVFVEFVALLALGWLVNVLGNPAYVIDLGTGALRWVSVGCVATAVLNAGLGFLAGARLGGVAVVAVSALSLVCGYVLVIAAYHWENRVPFGQLLPRESVAVFATSLTGVVLFVLLVCSFSARHFMSRSVTAGATGALLAAIIVAAWVHPLRRRLIRWVFSGAAS